LSDEEVAKNKLRVFPLALEPILILVNENNPISNLDSAQVRAIFRGEITNWKEVGGEDAPVVVVTRLHCKKRPGHWKTILPEARAFRQERLNVQSAAEMVKRINDFKYAIGHTGAAWRFDPNDRVRAIRIDGHAPNGDNLKLGNYPFYRQLSAVTNHTPSADLLTLIRETQRRLKTSELARRTGLLPLGE
jgi:ABC-type phosphate transport system substrate-binding protein